MPYIPERRFEITDSVRQIGIDVTLQRTDPSCVVVIYCFLLYRLCDCLYYIILALIIINSSRRGDAYAPLNKGSGNGLSHIPLPIISENDAHLLSIAHF